MLSFITLKNSVLHGVITLAIFKLIFAESKLPLGQIHTAIETEHDELLKLFETRSASSVPQYEVVPLLRHRSRRDAHSSFSTLEYKLSAFKKDFHIQLEPRDDVISKTLIITTKKPGNIWRKEFFKPIGRFYQGHVISDVSSHVAMRELDKPGELTGAIYLGDHVYRLHPLTDKVKRNLSLTNYDGYHVITKRTLRQLRYPGFFPEPIETKQQDELMKSHLVKRVRREASTKYIEAMITLDKVSFDYYGNTSTDFVLAVANMVNRLYRDSSVGIDVVWTLTKIFIIETDEAGLDFTKQNIRSAVGYLGAFSKWAKPKNEDAGNVGHFDNGVLLSRRLCGLEHCSLGGVAYSGVPCSSSSGFSVNNGNGIDAAFYVAHEMGHNFGIPHDSGECNKGYIMAPGQSGGKNAFKWSSCSGEMFKSVFSRVSCYNNKPPKQHELPSLPPGYNYDYTKQCQLMHGPEYKQCPLTVNSCESLFCYKSYGCSSAGTPPIDGTPCGKRKWCIGGVCEDASSSLPPSVDGGWGAWGAYSGCSRTCGIGVQYRTRECTNPKPEYGGKDCPGSSKGEWKTCNKQACPSGSEHFRLYQCKQKKSSYVKYYIRGGAECYLSCSEGGYVYDLKGLVIDGTKYNDDPLDYDLCIGGQRVVAGCDHEINSGTVLDRCAKCDGNGNSCKRHKGLYDQTGQPSGIDNAVPVLTLPIGTTSFHIQERSPGTSNLLNIKLDPPEKNNRLFSVLPGNTSTQAAGVTIKYWRSSGDLVSIDSMSFVGPSTAALVPLYVQVLSAKNIGYDYSYYLPGEGASSTYLWKAVPHGDCNETCAEGFKQQKVMCARKDDETAVSRKYCNLGNMPLSVTPCNKDPCKAKWEPDLWGQCSHRCGGGERKRLVPCVQKVQSYPEPLYRSVEEYYCNISIRSRDKEECNQIPCGPSWKMGDWSRCNRGTAKRSIQCIDVQSNGKEVPLNASLCNPGGIDLSPPTVKNCTESSGHHLRSCATVLFSSLLMSFFGIF